MFEAFVEKKSLQAPFKLSDGVHRARITAIFVSVQLDPRGRFTQLYSWITQTIQHHIISLLPSRTIKWDQDLSCQKKQDIHKAVWM